VIDGERKQVSVLFADLIGYTAFAVRLDPEDTREIMGRIFSGAAEMPVTLRTAAARRVATTGGGS
jgi:class 3 adenylate cyclase